jgi:RNA polymerase sigma-70 factor (ECF subfamily)
MTGRRKVSSADSELGEIVAKARSGDRAAFGALIEATQSRLFRFCLTLSGDRAFSEDLCQETYVKVYHNLSKLEKDEAFLGWLFQIARHLFIDEKRSKNSQATPLENEDPSVLGIDDRDFAQLIAVQQTLSHFDPDDRWLLLMVDLEGLTYKEAAEALKVTEDTVRTRIFRLRQKFSEIMSKV